MTKAGGIAALIAGVTYLIGFALVATLLGDTEGMAARAYVGFLADHQPLMYGWTLLIYVVNGCAFVVLALATHERLRAAAPTLATVAAAFGLIWAGLVIASGMLRLTNLDVVTSLYASDPQSAAALWPVLAAVEDGLGGGVEVPGGLWVLLVGVAALRSSTTLISRPLGGLGVIVGGAGILTLVPGVAAFEALFGLGMIAWFVWAGIAFVRSDIAPAPVPAAAPATDGVQATRGHRATAGTTRA